MAPVDVENLPLFTRFWYIPGGFSRLISEPSTVWVNSLSCWHISKWRFQKVFPPTLPAWKRDPEIKWCEPRQQPLILSILLVFLITILIMVYCEQPGFSLLMWALVTFYMQTYCWWKKSLHHLSSINPYKNWDILHINWCRISSINSIFLSAVYRYSMLYKRNGVRVLLGQVPYLDMPGSQSMFSKSWPSFLLKVSVVKGNYPWEIFRVISPMPSSPKEIR